METIAIFADIHGNSVALRAVLADIANQRNIGQLICLGDLAVYGPDPASVLSILRQYDILYVCGNTDRYLVQNLYPENTTGQDWQTKLLASFPWTASKLGEADMQFLARLPAQFRLPLDENHTIMAVHGSPASDEDNLLADTPEAEIVGLFGDAAYDLLLCAHTHIPLDRTIAGRRVLNPGSVGIPFDGDPQASYALVHPQPAGGYHIEIRRINYDIEKVVGRLVEADHPAAEIVTHNLRTALRVSPKLPYTERMRQGR
jgi:putative phosphoesterase